MDLTLEQLKQLIKEEVANALNETQEEDLEAKKQAYLDNIFGPTPKDAPAHPTLGVIPQGSDVTARIPRKGQEDFVFTGSLRYPDHGDIEQMEGGVWKTRDPKEKGNEWVILQDGEYGDYPCYLKRVVEIHPVKL